MTLNAPQRRALASVHAFKQAAQGAQGELADLLHPHVASECRRQFEADGFAGLASVMSACAGALYHTPGGSDLWRLALAALEACQDV